MNLRPRLLASLSCALALVVAAGCSTDAQRVSSPGGTAASSSVGGAVVAEPTSDELTPLIVSDLGDPIPFAGTDGRIHLAYELTVLNASPRTATLTKVETLHDGAVVGAVQGEELVERTMRIGSMPMPAEPASSIPPGTTVALALDDSYASMADVPDRFTHRIAATFGPVDAGTHPFASQFPSSIDQIAGEVQRGPGQALRIASPLAGPNWLAMNACCTVSSHRGAVMPLNGRLNASERYAIDWVQVNTEIDPATLAPTALPTYAGDPGRNEAYLAYDEPLYAVAAGTVVAAVDDQADATPQELPEGLELAALGGNHLVIDLGDGFYAFYAHVRHGSFTVKVGDRVEAGDVVGRLGNTGNSSEAHLHFHISRGPTPLASTQWPYEITAFDLEGTIGPDRTVVATAHTGPVTDAMPLALDVVTFSR